MTSIKSQIKTDDMINGIKMLVNTVISEYLNFDSSWKGHVEIAYYSVKTLALFATKTNKGFSGAYDEITALTQFNELYKISDIFEYIKILEKM